MAGLSHAEPADGFKNAIDLIFTLVRIDVFNK